MFFSATEMSRSDFCITGSSALAHGFALNVLGTRRQKKFDEFGPLDKLWALKEFVDSLPDQPNVIVAFIDAYGDQRLPPSIKNINYERALFKSFLLISRFILYDV